MGAQMKAASIEEKKSVSASDLRSPRDYKAEWARAKVRPLRAKFVGRRVAWSGPEPPCGRRGRARRGNARFRAIEGHFIRTK